MSLFSSLFGDETTKHLRSIESLVVKINGLEDGLASKTDAELKATTGLLKERLSSRESLDDLLPEAFALVREAAKRTVKQRHFDVQLVGGITLHRGKIAEMRTGEGKTLVATLPVYLNALTGKGVHVVTVNDYLSRRDAVWMGQIYAFLGLSVAVINHESSYRYDETHTSDNEKNDAVGADALDKQRDELGAFKVVHEFLRPCTRTEAYAADITYGTNNEFGFDYLRDHLVYSPANVAQRGYKFAIVDEVDSILIDESRTPLIISSPFAEAENLYHKFTEIARAFTPEVDYEVDEKLRAITLKDAGIDRAEKMLGIDNIYTEKGIKYVHHLETAVRARALFERDREYVVKDGEVVIVDEATGRLQPGRRWSEGLHQAIEAKEGVDIQKESRTLASITFQNYFRLYEKLAGMTGTAVTSKEEFYTVYGLDVITIPTNKTVARSDLNDLIFQTEKGKFQAIATKIKDLYERGQPVLVGTVSIEKNELLSAFLTKEGVRHEILNAKNHEREGEIVAQAGRKGGVTIATNMAGRGVDVLLGGAPYDATRADEVRALGGLFVLGTERHEARRIDNQLRGRAGRQGDPGATQFFVSLEDSLMRVFASDMVKKMMGRFGIPEDEAIENRYVSKAIEAAQTKIEGFHFDARKHLLEYDDVLNHHRRAIYTKRERLVRATNEELEEYLTEISGVPLGENLEDQSPSGAEISEQVEKRPLSESKLNDEKANEFRKMVAEKKAKLGPESFAAILRQLVLQVVDLFWMEHLEAMEYMRGSVRLRAYGQRDPLVEYKREGLRLFKTLEDDMNAEVLRVFPTVGAVSAATLQEPMAVAVHESASSPLKAPADEATERRNQVSAPAKVKDAEGNEVGRNDPCPCGSEKKYKKCHGA
ncbi:MAG: preprotein translocase subunit SecA [Candidatus Vogelbacteria bacterium CG10_big_fil_rev_8_21_14_0_10_51_16]|uniref:Protein translocase subunit SecA n=1 Tax=Candidatus Vogelbacteria bacterium CG10_big_fil_rev_8_21_14_0_10_51_16 TaxID=1975045 RepID=A0A2H0RF25_9BACT|nr:MAG: preprotein translocase subunit SecA [Candidatus Vogelbacteria bacterium CG10_big_fil_rev_8_21_14_0_10_51_16]